MTSLIGVSMDEGLGPLGSKDEAEVFVMTDSMESLQIAILYHAEIHLPSGKRLHMENHHF